MLLLNLITFEYTFFRKIIYNHDHNILRLFDILLNFLFTTGETKGDYQ